MSRAKALDLENVVSLHGIRPMRIAVPLGILIGLGCLKVWMREPNLDQAGRAPLARWVFESSRMEGNKLKADQGPWDLAFLAPPQFEKSPEAVYCGGGLSGAGIAREKGKPGLAPSGSLSLLALVRLDAGDRKGGIVGRVEDNRYGFQGTYLGYDETHFVFGLAPGGPDIGEGRPKILRSSRPFARGAWTLVAATFDGDVARLYVNGELSQESAECKGAINWFRTSDWAIGRFEDEDDRVPMIGAIREVEIHDRALSGEELKQRWKLAADWASSKAPSDTVHFVVAPYLQFPDADGFRVCLETSLPVVATVEYGEQAPFKEKVSSGRAASFHELNITGLGAGKQGYYRVVCKSENGRQLETPILPWQTAPVEPVPFSFALIGDTQSNPRATGLVTTQMRAQRPNFVLHLGDVVDDGKDKRMWIEDLFRPSQELFGAVPLYPSIGNHEKNHPNYYKYFSLPNPEYRYRFSWANADFFVLDSNKSMEPGSEQYVWLDEQMGKSKATWKFCYHHHPVYSGDSNDYGDTFAGKQSGLGDPRLRPLAPIYEKHKVDIVFNGHVHLYERTHPIRAGKLDETNGVMYLTSGGGGGGLENFTQAPAWFKAACRVDYHTTLITISNRTLELKAIDKDGIVFDMYRRVK